jgi:hypothetical protein
MRLYNPPLQTKPITANLIHVDFDVPAVEPDAILSVMGITVGKKCSKLSKIRMIVGSTLSNLVNC